MLAQETSDDQVVEVLIARGLIDAEAQERIAAYQSGPEPETGGILFALDAETMNLWVGDPLGRGGETVALPEAGDAWDAGDCPPYASPTLALFSDDGQRTGEVPLKGKQGFLLTDDECFLVGADFRHEENLPLGNVLWYNGAGARGGRNFPRDLSLSPDFRFLVVTDRAAGSVTLLDAESFAVVQHHQVRAPGSNKAINLAWQGGKIYATDGQTSAIAVLDVERAAVSRQTMNIGVLGNLLPHPDGRRLFLLTLKPNFSLFVIDPAHPVPEKAVPIKGDPYSLGQDPTDQMALSPDGRTLLMMTFINEPTPYTPVINVVDVATQKNLQRYRLPANRKPAGLGFSRPNPFFYPRVDKLGAALALGLIDEVTVATVRAEMAAETFQLPRGAAGDNDELLTHVAAQKAAQEAQKEGDKAVGGRQVERTDHVPIAGIAEDLIVEHAAEQVYLETKGETDLKQDAMAMDRLKTAAHKVREELEWYTASRLHLSFISGEQHIDMWIEREEVLEWLREQERDQMLKESKITTIPANCPNCGKNLFGSYSCRLCGFELDVPEAMKQKRRLSLASPAPTANLQDGNVLLPDADRGRVIELDGQRQILWQVAKDLLQGDQSLELQAPYDAVRLANGNTLIVDNQGNRIIEVTPRGRPFWDVPQNEEFPDIRLYRPVRALRLDGGNTLIVDRGHHRIIEIDRQFELKWQYGQTEMPGAGPGSLWHPSDVQRLPNGNTLVADMGNHRVIEISDGQVIWQYGNPENVAHGGEGREPGRLDSPKSAWRNESGETLIVDSGNDRVLVISHGGEIVWEFETKDNPDASITQPLRVYSLANGNLMVLGRDQVMEVNPRKQIVWSCLLKGLTKLTVTEDDSKNFSKFKLQRNNPYLRQLEERRQEEAGPKAAAAAVPAEPDLSDEKVKAVTHQDRVTEMARLAASRLNQTEEATSNLTPLAMLLVYRARNLVYRVSRQKRILWRWGNDHLDRPHSAQILNNSRVLVVDTNHHQVLEVDTNADEVVWSYGERGKASHQPGCLATPRWAQRLPNGNTLIADQSNNRVVEVHPEGEMVWQWGSWETLNGPYCCQRLGDGTTLVTDWSNHVVSEVSAGGEILWQYGQPKHGGAEAGLLHYPEQATRLNNGNTLIVDTRNNRILEVNPDSDVIWTYSGEGLHKLNGPTYAQRQPDNHTVIVHGGNRQAIEVDPTGQVVWKYLLPVERD